jgi:RNA polymerase sigma-70 factor (ECF subfamily)
MTPPSLERLADLMASAQRGDAGAYRELLALVTPRIRAVVRRQRGFVGRAEIEDIVQEVLLSLHSVRATYDPARPFVPWLMAIVRNRLADGARRYRRTAAREVAIDADDVTFLDDATNTGTAELGDAEALRDAVAALPEGQRRAIELMKLDELSLKEAAAISGMSVGSLKVATHRALAALRKALKQ